MSLVVSFMLLFEGICPTSSSSFIMVVMIYEHLLRHGASSSVVSMELAEALETPSATARWKHRRKGKLD